ncbi:transcription termination factor 3, mitochondrial [Battus philenor]|uniref:transcription termination factor 3, mitochondrial n=1 Tax=Battus philenor TaxID=42288 RepID=UPI0035CEF526
MNWLQRFLIFQVKVKSNSMRYFHSSFCNLNLSVNIKENGNSALQVTSEDLSTVTSYLPESYNLAAYVNKSETLKNLLHLNVNLSKIEQKPFIAQKILELDFEKDIKNSLLFLKKFVDMENIGNFITKNPLILCEDLNDLEVRLNYLESKQFKYEEICRIITKNPFWLMFSTIRIDKRLGFFQNTFNFCGSEVKFLAVKQPQLITYSLHHIKTNSFVIKEEMGFDDYEVKHLILSKPRLWMMTQRALLERFNYVHNVMQIAHKQILQYPNILLCRNFIIKQRHEFLDKLGRSQYDPRKDNFVPLSAFIEETDVNFCQKYAKCHIDDFNTFLKTM